MLIEIIKEFVSYDQNRPKILTPWIRDNKVYVTNGHILLSFPVAYIYNIDIFMSPDAGLDTSQCMISEGFEDFDIALIESAIKGQDPLFTIEPEFEKCEDCFGEGEYETDDECDQCHSIGTKTIICQECEGSGSSKIPNPKKGKKRYEITEISLQLPQREVFAGWHYLNVVQKTISFFKGTWMVSNRDVMAPIHFKQNEEDIDIVLMPMRPNK